MDEQRAPAALEIADGVATVTLDNPIRRNVLNAEMLAVLPGLLAQAAASPDAAAILLRAEGPAFCAGGDLKAMFDAGDGVAGLVRRAGDAVNEMITTLYTTDKIVIAAVRGAVAGAGVGLVAVADIVLAADNAKFATAYASMALTPDAGITHALPRTIGMRPALDLCLRRGPIDAVRALELGLVSEVVEPHMVESRARVRALEVANGPTEAYRQIKRLLRAGATRSHAEQLNDEIETLAAAATRPEFRARASRWVTSTGSARNGERPSSAAGNDAR